jgi:hypothetical protein
MAGHRRAASQTRRRHNLHRRRRAPAAWLLGMVKSQRRPSARCCRIPHIHRTSFRDRQGLS